MCQESFKLGRLSIEQVECLVEIIRESSPDLYIGEFSERVLLLLEDVSGFECVSDSEAKSIINKLWSLYHDQSK